MYHRDWTVIDPRKEKRALCCSTAEAAMYEAWCLGGYHGELGTHHNPYPAGRRHDEYDRGFDLADPMGAHYGANV
jgi:hypothetical protein